MDLSEYKTFTGTINSSNNDIKIRIKLQMELQKEL
jgi:hypothetical protein